MAREQNLDLHNLYDLDMERAVLSSVIFSEDNLAEISDTIEPNDFYLKAHADIYAAMIKCMNSDEPIQTGFIKKRLGDKFDEEIFAEVLGTNSILDIKKFANELKEKSIKRSLVKIAHQIPNKVNEELLRISRRKLRRHRQR